MLFKIFIAIIIIAVFFFLLFVAMIYFLSNGMRPNTIEESVREMSFFLGMELGNDYEVIEHSSQNNHGDRPLKIKIILSEVEFQKVKLFLTEIDIDLVKKYNISKNALHSESWRKDETHYYKRVSEYFINASEDDLPFFIAELSIDLDSRTISYKEYGL
jgi:hypothetical protein